MTMKPDGSFVCDKDGVDVGNGGLALAVIVSDVDPDTGGVRVFHFCRDRVEPDGTKAKGCARRVLSTTNLKHYLEDKADA